MTKPRGAGVARRANALAARNRSTLERYLASLTSPRTRETRLEGLERIARLFGKSADRVDWGALRNAQTSSIAAKLAATAYGFETLDGSMKSLRGVLRQGFADGTMTERELELAIDVERPDRIRERLRAADARVEARRNGTEVALGPAGDTWAMLYDARKARRETT